MTKLQDELSHLFSHYIKAFRVYSVKETQACYQIPCTLHTSDRVVYISDEQDFTREFEDIFAMLKQANIHDSNVLKASYSLVNEHLIIACVDWQFLSLDVLTQTSEVYTEFSAFYHISKMDDKWKIINVVSQDIEQSKDLEEVLIINK